MQRECTPAEMYLSPFLPQSPSHRVKLGGEEDSPRPCLPRWGGDCLRIAVRSRGTLQRVCRMAVFGARPRDRLSREAVIGSTFTCEV
jgi:hypothetical protein